jgi:hypothetical protein
MWLLLQLAFFISFSDPVPQGSSIRLSSVMSSRRSSRSSSDHNAPPAGTTLVAVQATPRAREACAETFANWTISTSAPAVGVSIDLLMLSCQQYAAVTRAENLGDLLNNKAGFARRLRQPRRQQRRRRCARSPRRSPWASRRRRAADGSRRAGPAAGRSRRTSGRASRRPPGDRGDQGTGARAGSSSTQRGGLGSPAASRGPGSVRKLKPPLARPRCVGSRRSGSRRLRRVRRQQRRRRCARSCSGRSRWCHRQRRRR